MTDYDSYRKILIVRLSSLGDIVLLTPLVRSLREKFPKARLDFLIKEQFSALVAHNAHLDRVIAFDPGTGLRGFIQLARQLASERYDLILDMHNNWRSHLLSLICRRPIMRYHKPRLRRFFLFYLWTDFFPADYSLRSAYYRVVAPLGIAYHSRLYPEIFLPPEAVQQAQAMLSRRGIDQPYVVLLPIATWPNKLYPLESYLEVARWIEAELGLNVVWLGGSRDEHLLRLRQIKKVPGLVLCGETGLMEALALLKGSRAVVGNDTGLTYAAEALGVPTVLILGPTARQTGAGCCRPDNITLEREIWCRPCSQKGDRQCYRRRRYCLESIDSSQVCAAIEQILR